MSNSVIRVENLGKSYRIGERERYLALRDVIARAVSAPARIFRARNRSARNGDPTHVWALKDASFEISPGEVMGIIGRNGAGKTTLLKILARVTCPTTGFAEVRGRMGSLLEVGTGFHPELTGRENTFLSGAILGMSKAEIVRKFDEIVAFAEVERFIDTPVKHYSVGMRMRLAFAVAAHLEPEILLVDEVLSVGDLEFQKKCLGKMGKVAEGGRTILFVSHQMNQVRRLCQRALWIDDGKVRADGPAKSLVNQYEASCLESTPARGGSLEPIVFTTWRLSTSESNVLDLDDPPGKIAIEIHATVRTEIRKGTYIIGLRDSNNTMLWSNVYHDIALDPGPAKFIHELAQLPLNPGIYTWEVRFNDGHKWSLSILVPELSITSKTDSAVFEHVRGVLDLETSFAMEQPASAIKTI
jgi:ABC-type polysaccharide/polyol phosphate transport system ATPase subunit